MIHRRILMLTGALLIYATSLLAAEAEPVVLATGQPDAMYAPGRTEGGAVLVPVGVNKLGLSLDRQKMDSSTAGVTIRVICEQFDGIEWISPACGAFTTTGGILLDRFTNKPISASLANFSFSPSVLQENIRISYEIVGGSIQTNSAIQMKEVTP